MHGAGGRGEGQRRSAEALTRGRTFDGSTRGQNTRDDRGINGGHGVFVLVGKDRGRRPKCCRQACYANVIFDGDGAALQTMAARCGGREIALVAPGIVWVLCGGWCPVFSRLYSRQRLQLWRYVVGGSLDVAEDALEGPEQAQIVVGISIVRDMNPKPARQPTKVIDMETGASSLHEQAHVSPGLARSYLDASASAMMDIVSTP